MVVFVKAAPASAGLQIVPAAPMPPTAAPPSTWATVGQLAAWTAVVAADAAYKACMAQAQEYIENTFATWYSLYSGAHIAGPTGVVGDPNAVPPAPPAGAQAQMNITGLGFDLVQTGPPVCSVPPYTKLPPPSNENALAELQNELGQSSGSTPSPFTKATPVTGQQTAPDGSLWIRIA